MTGVLYHQIVSTISISGGSTARGMIVTVMPVTGDPCHAQNSKQLEKGTMVQRQHEVSRRRYKWFVVTESMQYVIQSSM